MRSIILPFIFMLGLPLFSSAQHQGFRVQIAAFADSMPADYFTKRGIQKCIRTRDQLGMYRYFAGTYASLEEAESVAKSIREKGFQYAQVIDLEEQRVLSGTDCPYYRNGVIIEKKQPVNPRLRTIYFESGGTALTPESKVVLDEMALLLDAESKVFLNIQGHSDAMGAAVNNAELAATRARNARNYLIAKGIRADRMFIKVYGEADPAAPHKDDDGVEILENRQWNRRVVLEVSMTKPEGY